MSLYPAPERAMKIQEVILRAASGKILWMQAAEILDFASEHAALEGALPGASSKIVGQNPLLTRCGARMKKTAASGITAGLPIRTRAYHFRLWFYLRSAEYFNHTPLNRH